MAYLYRKNRSPFWYVVHFDDHGNEVHKSTKLRADDPNQTLEAKAMRADLEAKAERRSGRSCGTRRRPVRPTRLGSFRLIPLPRDSRS